MRIGWCAVAYLAKKSFTARFESHCSELVSSLPHLMNAYLYSWCKPPLSDSFDFSCLAVQIGLFTSAVRLKIRHTRRCPPVIQEPKVYD